MFFIGWITSGSLLRANNKVKSPEKSVAMLAETSNRNTTGNQNSNPKYGTRPITNNEGRMLRAGEKVLYIVVDKTDYTLTGYTDEKKKKLLAGPWLCTIGSNPDRADKQQVGDCRTPEGRHIIVSVEDSHDRMFEGELAYGPWFLRLKGLDDTNKAWSGIAIHGHAVGRENELGTNASHGCVRIKNANIKLLRAAVVPNKTIVQIAQ